MKKKEESFENQRDLQKTNHEVKEDTSLEETHLEVVEPEVEQDERSSSSSSPPTGWSQTTLGSPSSSSSSGLGGDCYVVAQEAGGTGGLQEISFQVRGENSITNILHVQGDCKRASDHSGIYVPRGSVKTTSGVVTSGSLTNHSKEFSIICEAQQGLATPSATSQGIQDHQQNIPSKKIGPEGLKRLLSKDTI